MVDPTSDLNEDVSPDEAPECETCGATLAESPDHRVITWIEDDEVQSAHFCNDRCRMDWNPEN
jgi:hypothetical protein